MPRSSILEEMKPGGILRASIRDLAAVSGAYIIVSSQGSLADSSLTNRRAAMAEAVRELPSADLLYLDFYDRSRIATWVREYPGIVLWVREKIGASTSGWKPYGDWAYSNGATDAPYLLDDTLRIQRATSNRNASASQGLVEIRKRLAKAGGVVRLVGLSGTGKTRFAQALFDDRIANDSLATSMAVYANISDGLSPQPTALASDLIAQRSCAVLIVDNCPPDLHESLSDVCRRTGSTLSLLTIEYDVRDHQPEGTDVYELQPASGELIKRLLQIRYHELSHLHVDAVINFSGGNARVALALAGTFGRTDSLAELQDTELLKRLFRQRHEDNQLLSKTAQACSLVYSFDGEETFHGALGELWRLAEICGIDDQTFYENIAELRRRDLLQKRGVWRALLPQAIANRLASLALENLLPANLHRFCESIPPRLLRSFSRRLGYLHTSEHARNLVTGWLSSGGLLERIEELNDLLTAVLVNVAPVAPDETLNAISAASERRRQQGLSLSGEEFRILLRSLAYESRLFDQAFSLLVDLIEHDVPSPYANQIRNDLGSLFQLYLSGTHATVEQRIAAVERLLTSASDSRREFGYSCLNAMMKTGPFSSMQHFDFGGRPRDFGYQPANESDVGHWFRSALALCARVDLRGDEAPDRVRKIVSEAIWGLWIEAGLYDEVEIICRTFAERRYWPEGWIALRSIRRLRQEPLPQEQDEHLRRIEDILQPCTVQERVRVFVLRRVGSGWDDLGITDWEAQLQRLHETSIELGATVAQDAAILDELLPELMMVQNTMALGGFAKGMVDSGATSRDLWRKLTRAFAVADSTKRNVELLACFLLNLSIVDVDTTEELLAESATDTVLRPVYPYLQSRVLVSDEALIRLKDCLVDDTVPAGIYLNLGHAKHVLTDDQLASIIPIIADKSEGFSTALDCLWSRVMMGERDNELPPSDSIISTGRQMLAEHIFTRHDKFADYHYREVAKCCLAGPSGEAATRTILQHVKEAVDSMSSIGFYDAATVLSALLAVQPIAVLDQIYLEHSLAVQVFLDWRDRSALDGVPEDTLIAWCEQDNESRYPWVASHLCFFQKINNTNSSQWKPVARSLLDRATNSIEVMKHYIAQLAPRNWSGSRAATWEVNLTLLDNFDANEDHSLQVFVSEQRARVRHEIALLRSEEDAIERRANERFE